MQSVEVGDEESGVKVDYRERQRETNVEDVWTATALMLVVCCSTWLML